MADQQRLFELKSRLLVEGVSVAELSPTGWKERIEHLYEHDGGGAPPFRYPQELLLMEHPDPALDTVVTVRYNPASPWRLTSDDLGLLRLNGPDLDSVMVQAVRRPAYYDYSLADGSLLSTIVQHLGRDALGVVPNNYCSYFGDGEQCRFCEIEPSFRAVGSYHRIRKPVQVIVDAVNLAISEPTVRYLIMTAGNLRSNDKTAEYYCRILREVRDGAHGRIYKYASIMAPESFHQMDALKHAGLDGIGFNLEFYDPGQFGWLAPGKARYGRDRLLAALEYATGVFGRGHVFSNLVFGIQTWREPGAAVNFDREVDACLEASTGLLERHVIPLFTLYHYSGKNSIGPVALRADRVTEFHTEYARLVNSSRILPAGRTGVLFNTGTIANHVCNDAVAAVRQHDLESYRPETGERRSTSTHERITRGHEGVA